MARPTLQRQGTLPCRGHELVQHTARLAGAAEPLQPGHREHERVRLSGGELAQPGVDVSAQIDHGQVAAHRTQLGRPAQAARAHPRPGRKLGQ